MDYYDPNWRCPCDQCNGIFPDPPEPYLGEFEPEIPEFQHLDGCTLPPDHKGFCEVPNLGVMVI